jgi:hypothetical protein
MYNLLFHFHFQYIVITLAMAPPKEIAMQKMAIRSVHSGTHIV